jgi:hypothetical protein
VVFLSVPRDLFLVIVVSRSRYRVRTSEENMTKCIGTVVAAAVWLGASVAAHNLRS